MESLQRFRTFTKYGIQYIQDLNKSIVHMSISDFRTIESKLQKLEAYESTGLTPEEIQNDIRVFTDMWEEKLNGVKAELQAYKDAEEQGLLIKLPCKAGDNLYIIYDDENYVDVKEIYSFDIGSDGISITDGPYDGHVCYVHELNIKQPEWKSVFTTREAAEVALKGSGAE